MSYASFKSNWFKQQALNVRAIIKELEDTVDAEMDNADPEHPSPRFMERLANLEQEIENYRELLRDLED